MSAQDCGPVSIGGVRLDNPYVLAPMAGVGDPPFRRLCRRGGAGMVCAEMVSANALHYGDETSRRMLAVFPDEHPVSMQLFGNEPDRLAAAARMAEQAGADVVDLNCGCPVPKIAKTGAGVSLMKDEALFSRCVEAMARSVKVPVTVKMRLGFTRGENRAVRFARLARESGAAGVVVHARAQEARHDGPPDLAALAETVAAAGVPVFGNGGVSTPADARRMMQATGCAGVLVGQAAVGNPHIFMELNEDVRGGDPEPRVSGPQSRLWLLKEHARMIAEYYGESLGIRRLRKYVSSYVHGLPRSAEFRRRAVQTETLRDFLDLVAAFESSLLEWAASRPAISPAEAAG